MASYCATYCVPREAPVSGSAPKPPGLIGRFFTWLKTNPTFLDEMFRWQDSNRHSFQAATDEYPIEATVAFNELMHLVDHHFAGFLAAHNMSEEQFSVSLAAFQDSDDPFLKNLYNKIHRLMMQRTDFLRWAHLVRKNTCLCCGGGFREQQWGEAANLSHPTNACQQVDAFHAGGYPATGES